jgi:hypothetical protein
VEHRSGSDTPDPDEIAQLQARADVGDGNATRRLADPEDWAFMQAEELVRLLARRGDVAAIAELRARAEAGDLAAAKWLAG